METAQIKAKLSNGFQITVPSMVRKALGLEAGDTLDIALEGNRAVLVKAETREETIARVFAEMDRINEEARKRMTPEQKKRWEMMKGWTVNQYHEYFDNLPETKAYLKEKYGV